MPGTYGIIPARLHATRLPKKLLLADTGRPLIQHTWEAARGARKLDDVLIATDSLEIAQVVEAFGGKAYLTGEHPSGTDRIAEVVRRELRDAELIVNIQGDEPEIDPTHIDRLVTVLANHPSAPMATLACPLREADRIRSPSCVKVVCDESQRALYFSRAVIPWPRDYTVEDALNAGASWLLHLGIYAYRRDFLLRLTSAPPSALEQIEKLEQLRALEMGATIMVDIVQHHAVGIDTPEDYAQFVQRMRRRSAAEVKYT